jgi:hypothetical protein
MLTLDHLGLFQVGWHLLSHSAALHVALWLGSLFALGTAINSGQNTAAAWEAYVGTDPVDNIFARHWLLEQLRANGSFEKQNGVVIRHNLEYALNPNVKFMSEMETVTVSRPDTFDNAEYSWKFIGGDVPMTDFERGITSGGAAKFDLEARKLENLKNTLEEKTNTSMFSDGTGTASKEFGGLQLVVSSTPTTGTVGLINRATFAFFRNQQVGGSGTSFSILLASMTTAYNSASNGIGSQNPTFGVTTQTVFEGFESLTPTIERLVRESPSDKLVRGFKGQNVMFKDIPVGYDPACPTGNFYILNNRNLHFIYMQWMKGEAAVRPSDGFWDVFKVLTIGNLTTDNPRRLAVVTAIT